MMIAATAPDLQADLPAALGLAYLLTGDRALAVRLVQRAVADVSVRLPDGAAAECVAAGLREAVVRACDPRRRRGGAREALRRGELPRTWI
jgi:hypothetical protein